MLRPLLSLLLGFTLLLGVAVPLGVTALASLTMPERAGGSLIRQGDRVIGSALIGQDFAGDRGLHGRLAAARNVPADAATAIGSGLDPHISPENAAAQVARVAQARGLPAPRVAALVEQHLEDREFGLLGEPSVNVLRLNLALDALR